MIIYPGGFITNRSQDGVYNLAFINDNSINLLMQNSQRGFTLGVMQFVTKQVLVKSIFYGDNALTIKNNRLAFVLGYEKRLYSKNKNSIAFSTGLNIITDYMDTCHSFKIGITAPDSSYYSEYTNYQGYAGIYPLFNFGIMYKRQLSEKLLFTAQFESTLGLRNLNTYSAVFASPGQNFSGNSTALNKGDKLNLNFKLGYRLF